MKEINWNTLVKLAWAALDKKGSKLSQSHVDLYGERLKYEIAEIDKQGANRYWLDIINEDKKFDTNKHGLLLPWLLGKLTGSADVDPISHRKDPLTLSSKYSVIKGMVSELGRMPFDIYQDDDKPDIDIDCLPQARDEIKAYASKRYGEKNVASVGTWQSYLFKQALGDTHTALGLNRLEDPSHFAAVLGQEEAARIFASATLDDDDNKKDNKTGQTLAVALTKLLPDDVNDMRKGGTGVCKGKVSDEDGERECGHEHKELQCSQCGSKDTDTPTIGAILDEFEQLRAFNELSDQHAKAVDFATRLIGCVRNAGKHAGAIIIADRDLFGNVPMQFDHKSGQWVSVWTEGRNTQLSKFGYTKWDILGLKNLLYIYRCCEMIEENHGISFGEGLCGLDDLDPEGEGRSGVYWEDGKKHNMRLHDDKALALANEQRTDAVFQFDTDLAKRNLAFKSQSFWDLLVFNAMGHPGPMAMIPEYVDRRDDPTQAWKKGENEEILKVLGSTNGIIVYQEQLTDLWQLIAGFTGPEAQYARKAVAKKWRDKLKPVRQKWIDGATRILGESLATEWWDDRMETFGRYAFNKSHAVSYCLWAQRCLWFKAYYPEEWWASVMGDCHQLKLERYMSAARNDEVKFGEIDINRITIKPAANAGKNSIDDENTVALGLLSLKSVGDHIAYSFADDSPSIPEDHKAPSEGYKTIDEFVDVKGKNKTLMERLIKLGAFTKLHPNIKATWMWYVHRYCSGEINFEGAKMKVSILKKKHRDAVYEQKWNPDKVEEERERQAKDYRRLYPKKKIIPKRILEWKPKIADQTDGEHSTAHVTVNRDKVMAQYPTDYSLSEILEFENQFLGYYWHSPCDLYHTSDDSNIENAKLTGRLEGVITDKYIGMTKKSTKYAKLWITDGSKKDCVVMLWSQDLDRQDDSLLKTDIGIRMSVEYDLDRNSFMISRGSVIEPLWTEKAWMELQEGEYETVS